MKKILIYVGIAIVIIVIAAVLIIRSLSSSVAPQGVSFEVKQDNLTVTLYQETNQATGESKQLDEFSTTKMIDLPKGKYYYYVTGENTDASTVTFSVPEETSFIVDPEYDSRYLASLLEKEVPIIDQLIETNYSKVTNGYKIHPGKFYKQGQWYATIISDLRSTNEDPYEDYRIVLNKQNGSWVAMTTPEISLSVVTFPEIPREILSDINSATPYILDGWSHTSSFDTH